MKNLKKHIIILLALIATYQFTVAQGDAELSLKTDKTTLNQGEEFTVDIDLKNPQAQSVISVRTWLEYNPALLEAIKIDTANTPFNLAAPGEDEISASEGRVKIGRSNISGGATDLETKVATITFKVVGANNATANLKFYDYQVTELGHTSVNIIEGGFPLNILAKEPEALSLNLNPGGAPASNNAGQITEIPNIPTTNTIDEPIFQGNIGGNIPILLTRPSDLRVNTGQGYVDLRWSAEQDINRAGFHIYYGKTSGSYSRRRTIGNNTEYRLDNLGIGETYYFAVTAYDAADGESDYSNEAAVIVGEPLSATHPFSGVLQQNYNRIPSQPQNGPMMGWLLFSATGLGASVVYRKK